MHRRCLDYLIAVVSTLLSVWKKHILFSFKFYFFINVLGLVSQSIFDFIVFICECLLGIT